MATIISRSARHFHYANRCFYSLHRMKFHSPSYSSSFLAGANSHDRAFHLQSGFGINYLATYSRLFSTTSTTVDSQTTATEKSAESNSGLYSTTSTTVDSQTTATEKSAESNSSDGDNSGKSNQNQDAGKPVRGGPVSWLSFLLLVATGAGLVFYFDREKKRHIEEINKASIEVKQGPSVGKAAIGGPFKLVNHDGKQVTEKDFFGKWTLLYFGFTHCPDICPEELQKLAAAVDKIKKAGIKILPIFISVDPERDNVEQVREYVKEFHPDLVGLTGRVDEIRNVARAYRVYYMKTEEEDSDYLVDHSIVMYLMGPDKMEFVKFFGKNNDVDSLADGIIKEIKQYKK